jgi:chaperonin GroEL
VTLINLALKLEADIKNRKGVVGPAFGQSEIAGVSILKDALEQPFRILLSNAGLNPDEWLPKVKAARAGFGVDVNGKGELVDLKAKGIVDPTRVTKEAVQNAASIAGTSITMGALVVDVPEKESEAPAGGGMPGGMGAMM